MSRGTTLYSGCSRSGASSIHQESLSGSSAVLRRRARLTAPCGPPTQGAGRQLGGATARAARGRGHQGRPDSDGSPPRVVRPLPLLPLVLSALSRTQPWLTLAPLPRTATASCSPSTACASSTPQRASSPSPTPCLRRTRPASSSGSPTSSATRTTSCASPGSSRAWARCVALSLSRCLVVALLALEPRGKAARALTPRPRSLFLSRAVRPHAPPSLAPPLHPPPPVALVHRAGRALPHLAGARALVRRLLAPLRARQRGPRVRQAQERRGARGRCVERGGVP